MADVQTASSRTERFIRCRTPEDQVRCNCRPKSGPRLESRHILHMINVENRSCVQRLDANRLVVVRQQVPTAAVSLERAEVIEQRASEGDGMRGPPAEAHLRADGSILQGSDQQSGGAGRHQRHVSEEDDHAPAAARKGIDAGPQRSRQALPPVWRANRDHAGRS